MQIGNNFNSTEVVDISSDKFCWTPVICGALVAIGLSFLLNLFSVAIGLSFLKTNEAGLVTLAVGGYIGLVIGGVSAMFVAGFVSGYLGRCSNPQRNLGVVYGFASWCLALILAALLAAQLGKYVSFYTNVASNPTALVNLNNNNAPVISENTADAANKLGVTSFLIFAIFFLGAFSSSVGGHMGMTSECCNKKNDIIIKKKRN